MSFKEYCKHGHLLVETRKRRKDGRCYCATCEKEYGKKYRQENSIRLIAWRRTYKQSPGAKVVIERYNNSEKGKESRRNISKKSHNNRRLVWLEFFEREYRDYCIRCGYNTCFAALSFHHIDPKEKKDNIGCLLHYNLNADLVKEINKTITLCNNCHAEFHAGVWKLEELDNG